MAGANKHKQRSKRSHFDRIPHYMFAIRAAARKNIQENRKNINTYVGATNGGKEETV